jgi:hypothetical protein
MKIRLLKYDLKKNLVVQDVLEKRRETVKKVMQVIIHDFNEQEKKIDSAYVLDTLREKITEF